MQFTEVEFTEQTVQRDQHRYAREYAGYEPTIILMHGSMQEQPSELLCGGAFCYATRRFP